MRAPDGTAVPASLLSEVTLFKPKGVWDESVDRLDPQKYYIGIAAQYSQGGMIGCPVFREGYP